MQALLESARSGRGGAFVIRGDAGIGKSALLDEAATVEGFAVLRARGIETESDISFAGLSDLLAPILDGLGAIPRRQAAAIESALGIGPLPATERLAISAGTLSLLAVASKRRPLVALVDDAHRLDRASADTLGFVARRLADDPIAVIFAVRHGELSTFAGEGIEELRLAPLDESASVALLDRRSRPVTPTRRAEILALAAGNPLAILELPEQAEAGANASTANHVLPPGSLLAKAFGGRIEQLPEPTRTALVVAAANDDDDMAPVLAACRVLGLSIADFGAAETSAVIEIDANRFRFRHPLVRAAAYAVASPRVRRAAHHALAIALVDRRTEERWAWHRALAAAGPDRDAAAALESSARRSIDAGARARAFERAARLTADEPNRARLLLAGALAAEEAANLVVAEALATESRRSSVDPAQIAELDHLLGRIWLRKGEVERATQALTDAAAGIAATDPHRAALMLADAIEATIHDLERAEAIAADAKRLMLPGGNEEQLVQLRLGDVYGWRGRATEADACWRRAAELGNSTDPASMRNAAEALFSTGLDDEAVRVGRVAADLARAHGAHNTLTQSLEVVAQAEARRGHVLDGLAAASEEIDLVVGLSQTREERYACVAAAWIEAALGRDADGRRHVIRAAELEAAMDWAATRSEPLGVLELASGRPDLAVQVFERVPIDMGKVAADTIAPRSFVPAYVDALVQVGRQAEARMIAVAYAEAAQRTTRPLAIGLGRRCLGIALGSVGQLSEAARTFDEIGNAYEMARTNLCAGQLLRRRGKRTEAARVLAEALDDFTLVGADGWAERARAELVAVGAPMRGPSPPRHSQLTPQERTVARLVADGLTNREVAERLFVTTNTIETHLKHVYQKLEVRSRTELAIAFRD